MYFVVTVWERSFSCSSMTVPLCKVCFEMSWHFAVWKNFLHNPAQSPDLNPTEHLWDELHCDCEPPVSSSVSSWPHFMHFLPYCLFVLQGFYASWCYQTAHSSFQLRFENRVFYGEYVAVLHGVWQLIFNLKIIFLKINSYSNFLCCNKTQFTSGFVRYWLPRVVWT